MSGEREVTYATRLRLVNGNTVPRARSSAGCEVLPCGCATDGREWLQMCEAHYGEWAARHEPAQHRGDLGRRHRGAEDVSLYLHAAFGAQDFQLLLGLDALGGGGHAEA